jgi:DNA-binding PadR family transcriptional regulator
MKTESASKFALLGILSLKPASGYDIKQFVAYSIGHFWNESYGRIYPLLKHLAREGLIAKQRQTKNWGRPERQVYTVTPAGEAALRGWLAQTPKEAPPRSELLLKLFFANRTATDISVAHVQEKKRLEEKNLAVYARTESELRARYASHPELPYWLLTLSFGRHRSQSLVDWCDEALQTLSHLNRKARKKKRGTS